jgi:hypothetical protein
MLQQLQNTMNQMQREQEKLATETVTGSAGGAVTVTITGALKVTEIKVSPEAVDPNDVALLEELLVSATNDAITKAQEMAGKRMERFTGGLKGLGLPGL